MRKLILGVFLIIVIASSLVYINLKHYIYSPSNKAQAVSIIIPKGYSVKKIAKELHKNEVISYPKFFWIVHRIFFSNYLLQAGEYEVPAHSSVYDIIQMLYQGRVVIHKFTIPDGITTKEILDQIQSDKMLFGEITKNFEEGDFIANTYNYTYGETKMMLLNRIFNESQKIIEELWTNRATNLPIANKKEAVILASIVEKETALASERARIAAVFINRLKRKMRLQADPTVIYAITKGQYKFNRKITASDLKIKSLYNTYLYPGLPPTSIANAGINALKAVLHPLQTKELYFVADGKGGHNFSEDLNTHNQHVSNYRKEVIKNAQ